MLGVGLGARDPARPSPGSSRSVKSVFGIYLSVLFDLANHVMV